LGDLDGDGITDLAVSAYGDDSGGSSRGAIYVLFLQPAQTATNPPGDYNQNGTTDAGDYVLWRKTGGTTPGYNLWRANFGNNAVPTAPPAATPLILPLSDPLGEDGIANSTAAFSSNGLGVSTSATDFLVASASADANLAITNGRFLQSFAAPSSPITAPRSGILIARTQSLPPSTDPLLLAVDQALAELDHDSGQANWHPDIPDAPSMLDIPSQLDAALAVALIDLQ
jgi:hypothetical protein